MLNTTTFVGLDVHARSIKAVALDAMTGEVRSATFAYDAAAVAEWVRSLDPAAKCVYESGVTGFDLQKRLSVYCQALADKIGVMISTLSAFRVPTSFSIPEIYQA